MAGQSLPAWPWVAFPELGGAFYVGEQEGESACWRAGHCSMSSLLPLRGHYSSGAFLGSLCSPKCLEAFSQPSRTPIALRTNLE